MKIQISLAFDCGWIYSLFNLFIFKDALLAKNSPPPVGGNQSCTSECNTDLEGFQNAMKCDLCASIHCHMEIDLKHNLQIIPGPGILNKIIKFFEQSY